MQGQKERWEEEMNQYERGHTETFSGSNLAVFSSGNTLCFSIHYLNEINEINQMNVRWNPCGLFVYLPTDCRLICVCGVSVCVSSLSQLLSFTRSFDLNVHAASLQHCTVRPSLEIRSGT